MKCSCPKCSANLIEDLSAIPEKGKTGKCPECDSSYWIHRESFMLRGYAVAGGRFCSSCGEALGQSTFCPGCGALYPDYCVVANKKPATRAFEKKHFTLNLTFPKFSSQSAAGSKTKFVPGGGRAGTNDLRRQLMMVGAGLALIAVLAVAALLYVQARAESTFASRFVVVLYGIKSGTDHCMKMSQLLASGSRLADKDLALLKSVKTENYAAIGILSPPPKKYIDVYSRLLKLFGTYEKLNTLCVTSGPSAEVASSAKTLEEQFYIQAKELKVALPSAVMAELTASVSRFRSLQFMLE